jgi:uncharacterized membrane protein YkoI
MNLTKLRRKRVVIPTIAAIAVLGAGATVWTASASDQIQGSERDRVSAAAVEAAGGGEVVDMETSDDRGEAYEVEVRQDDGTEVDIALDQDLNVLGQETDDTDSDDESEGDDGRDADDRALSTQERQSAEQAALATVDGTVTDVEASNDPGEAYEVEVLDADNVEWTVELDADFQVLHKAADD